MQVRGLAIRTTLQALEAEFGADASRRVMAALPPAVREAFSPVVLAASQYPVTHQAALHEAVRTVLGGTGANHRIGAAAARIDFGGVYRVFVLASSYESLLRGSDRAFRRYNSQGYVAWDHIGHGEARGRVGGVEGYVEGMWHAIAGRLEALLVLGGAKHAHVAIESWSPTDATFAARWR